METFVLALLLLFGGLAPIASKKAMQSMAEEWALVYFYAVSAPFLLAGVFLFSEPKIPGLADIIALIVAGIAGAIAIVALLKSYHKMETAIAQPLANIYVLMIIAISALFLNESLGAMQAVGATAILLSSAVIAAKKSLLRYKIVDGAKFIAITATGWTIYYIMLKFLTKSLGPYNTAFYSQALIGLIILAYVLLSKRKIELPTRQNSFFLLGGGLAIVDLSLAFNLLMQKTGLAITASISAGLPITTAVFAAVFLNEKLEARKYAAIALLVLGLIALNF
ncbi:MAG: DMT family transporter [Candidatus Diapherotrites archaeon]|nr:DMT family transporter [Candidatus Diapherotrites archaeon]